MRRIGVWLGAGLVLVLLCLVCLSVTLVGRTGAAYPSHALTGWTVNMPSPVSELPPKVEVEAVESTSGTVVITVTVQASGPQALLFDTPTLNGEYPTSESLEQARFALLDLTGGQAQIALEFPRPAGGPPWLLVFNPLHTPENQVAPRVEVRVEGKE